MKYSIYSSVKSKECNQRTVEEIVEILKWPYIKSTCESINRLLAEGKEDDASTLKTALPVIVLNQLYDEGAPRRKDGGKPTGAIMIDYDFCKTEEDLNALIADIKQKWLSDTAIRDLILGAHISPRRHGVHIWFRWIDGCHSVAECLERFAELIGIPDYDEPCKDNSRCSFLVPLSYFFIQNWDAMAQNEDFALLQEKQEVKGSTPAPTRKPSNHRVSTTDAPSGETADTTDARPVPLDYEGVPISQIVNALVRRCCPKKMLDKDMNVLEGARNNVAFKVAACLRYICDNRASWIMHHLPQWAHDLNREENGSLEKTICSACGRNLSFSFPKTLTAALRECGIYESNTTEQSENQAAPEMDNETAQQEYEGIEASKQKFLMFPDEVPPIFQEFCNGVKPEWKAAVVLTLLPTLGTCMSKLRARYIDGRLHSPSFQTVIEAKMASGKQNYADIADFVLTPITALDLDGNTQLNLYNAEAVKANNAKTLSTPPDVCVRKMIGRFTEAGLNSTLDTSKGLHIWSGVSEIDEVADVWKQLSYILRLAYDNSPYGRTLQSQKQFRGERNLFLNTFLCGTPNAVARVYRDPEDGLVSRTIFYKQMVETQGIPITKVSASTKARLAALIQKIHDQYCIRKQDEDFIVAIEQEVNLDYVNKHLCKWLDAKALEAAKYGSEAIERFRRRDACNGFRAGMVAHAVYLAMNKKMTNRERTIVKNFAEWVADYSLMMHDFKFGAELNRILAEDELQTSTSHVDILSTLPDTFTLAEAYKAFPYETTAAVRGKLKRLLDKKMLGKEGRGLYTKL